MLACGCISGDEKVQGPSYEWSLSLQGLVDDPIELSYSDLLDMASESFTADMEKTTGTVETNLWEGVPIEDLIDMAGVSDTVNRVVVSAFDGYTVTLLPDDLQGGLVAYKINDEYLPEDEPLRLVVPKMWGPAWMRGVSSISFESTEGLLEISGDAKSPQLLGPDGLGEYECVNVSYEGSDYEGVLIEDLLSVARYIYESTDILLYDSMGGSFSVPLASVFGNQQAVVTWEDSTYMALVIGETETWVMQDLVRIEVTTL